jgi:hypothetical protein
MVGDTDVAANGNSFDAASLYSAADTVNGVTFNSIASTLTDGKITFAPNNSTTGASTFPTASPSSTNYSHLVSTIAFGYQASSSVVFSNLTLNDTYQVQVFSWYTSPFPNAITTLSGSNTVNLDPSVGQFAIGTFTATAASEKFTLSAQGNGHYDIWDAVSVRDVTATPEPSTYVLLGLGFLSLVVLRKRRA